MIHIYLLNILGFLIFLCFVWFIKSSSNHQQKERCGERNPKRKENLNDELADCSNNDTDDANCSDKNKEDKILHSHKESIFVGKEVKDGNTSPVEDISFTYPKDEKTSSGPLKRNVHPPSIKKAKSSTELRETGNSFYRKASEQGLCSTLQKSRLQNALDSYYEALTVCQDCIEKSSGYKNIAIASKRLAQVMVQENDDTHLYRKQFKESLKNFVLASTHSTGRTNEWKHSLMDSFTKTVEEVIENVKMKEQMFKPKVVTLQYYLDAVSSNHIVSGPFIFELLELRYEEALHLFHQKSFHQCLQELYECKRLYEKVQHSDLKTSSEISLDEITIYIMISESVNARISGDLMLQNLLEQDVPLNATVFESVIMQFKEAVRYAKTYDIVAEATGLSRLGHVYDILSDKVRATKYFKECLSVLESCADKEKYLDSDWHKNCVITLQRYQDSIIEQPSERWQKERGTYLTEVIDNVRDLEMYSSKSHVQFLMHLYNKYPPKAKNNVFTLLKENEKLTDGILKKMYRKARFHYSPDKVDVSKHGKSWKVFCEEVSMLLNSRVDSLE